MEKLKIILATNNPGKLREVRALLNADFTILSLSDVSLETEIPEDFETLEENALQKALFIHGKTGMNVLADDTGLEVSALNGEPGVFSARYAGEPSDSEKNIDKLLLELEGVSNRKAQFRTVMALIVNHEQFVFEGICEGEISEHRKGQGGFGYDPVFVPKGYIESFSQMKLKEKNAISHRGRALQKVSEYLKPHS